MKVIVIPRVRSTRDIFHFHQIQVVLFINSSRTYVVFPFNTTSTKNTTIYETNCHLFVANARARTPAPQQNKLSL